MLQLKRALRWHRASSRINCLAMALTVSCSACVAALLPQAVRCYATVGERIELPFGSSSKLA